MKTPICDFVEKYADKGSLRLHMPGHKGSPFLGIEQRDITEVAGADVLYSSSGIIAESQRYASALFGTEKTVYSTEGSSLCIRAMVYSLCVYAKCAGRAPLILAARNAHKTFMGACALCDARVEWLYPRNNDGVLSCMIGADELDSKIEEMSEKPIAVYITSPDYLGNVSDISGIAEVCRKRGVLLAVDNAHGAYLRFLSESRHPIDLGADICCDSAHKTLPVLTGGAYLHVSSRAPREICESVDNAMSLFASTSPSYLILQSLDMANLYVSNGYRARLSSLAKKVRMLKGRLEAHGFATVGDEEIKLAIMPKSFGYTGEELGDILRSSGVECEFCDPDHTVMMFTPETGEEEIERLGELLTSLPEKTPIIMKAPRINPPVTAMSLREAMMSPSELIDVRSALGRVLASASVSCPPAIPIIACGETVDESAIACFEYYGIEKIRVVTQNL